MDDVRYGRADSLESKLAMYTTSPSPLDEGRLLIKIANLKLFFLEFVNF